MVWYRSQGFHKNIQQMCWKCKENHCWRHQAFRNETNINYGSSLVLLRVPTVVGVKKTCLWIIQTNKVRTNVETYANQLM